ncbi:DUF4145 domain-containing protein [Dongshaea marina]|uniref:DUF4145 domain-containing protein n=1 Tax=Dongshaea marina TaxID=2047966 RepID=UPI000D3E7994|nr:DUF4145 domain-containing protein [Dongshaea marina]
MIPVDLGSAHVGIDKDPDTCPICKHKIVPNAVYNHANARHPKGFFQRLYRVYECPNEECSELYIAYYDLQTGRRASTSGINSYELKFVEPTCVDSSVIPQEIIDISSQYVRIKIQAEEAEQRSLSEVSGIAYRKALEFLVKDYAIHCAPEKEKEIKVKALSKVIKTQFKDSPRIVAAAERAAWLGNDETHYIRKWTNHDIQDLKRLLSIVEHLITTEEQLKQYEKELQPS